MGEDNVLYAFYPYVVRTGVGGDNAQPLPLYEVYNTETDMVEDRQTVLPNAVMQAKLFSSRLAELTEEVLGEDEEEE